jgi:hypothetical protein
VTDDKAVTNTFLDSVPQCIERDAIGDARGESFANGCCCNKPELVGD